MPKIKAITCHKFVNSRGDWTLGTKVLLDDGSIGVQTIPEGASKGENEAQYLPINKAVDIVSSAINDVLEGSDPYDQSAIDQVLLDMDGTDNKKHLGGNSILSVSLAVAKASASSKKQELYQYLADLYGNKLPQDNLKLPTPLFNILNGGKHANNGLSFQEFMVIPSPSFSYNEALAVGISSYHLLKKKLLEEGYEVDVGDEGGFAPNNFTVKKALDFLRDAVSEKYKPGIDIFFGIDVASGSFRFGDKYIIKEEKLKLTDGGLESYYLDLIKKYELMYIEDPFYEKDLPAWKKFTQLVGNKLLVVGDDLVVTNPHILKHAITQKLANAVIVKPNQVGTLTETLEFIKLAQQAKMTVIISHRSGDTAEDTFIADLAVAVGADFIKSGAPARGERVAKYNRLLDIFYAESVRTAG